VKNYRTALLLTVLAACGSEGSGKDDWKDKRKNREDYAVPVRVTSPSRGDVEDYIETQATLESDQRADIEAEVDGRIVERIHDVGAILRGDGNGNDSYILARIDDRDLRLALKEAEIKLRERRGQIRELELEVERGSRELDQARLSQQEAEAVHRRTQVGLHDGTISIEEDESARFARDLSIRKVEAADVALEKARVSITLGNVAIEAAQASVERAQISLERTVLRAPFAGIVTMCDVRVGERVRTGDLLYRVENTATLVVYADVPVRQATRVAARNPVLITSTATPKGTRGEVLLVAPTVERESGTVTVKIRVEPETGFKPGLFVTLRIVVETRDNALVVPKRAVLHDDEDGTYLFLIEDGKARRVLVKTGFEREGMIEVVTGVPEDAQVVIEGQDTVTDGATVAIEKA